MYILTRHKPNKHGNEWNSNNNATTSANGSRTAAHQWRPQPHWNFLDDVEANATDDGDAEEKTTSTIAGNLSKIG